MNDLAQSLSRSVADSASAATVVSNIGYWMYDVATGWLMVSLDANPPTVSMVQVANTLPMFLQR